MDLREELIAYQKRQALVEEKLKEERQNAPIELRWQQLNAAYALGKWLELSYEDSNEARVYELWARLKTQIVTP